MNHSRARPYCRSRRVDQAAERRAGNDALIAVERVLYS